MIFGELEPKQKAALIEHLAKCEKCKALLAEMRSVRGALKEALESGEPPRLSPARRAALLKAVAPTQKRKKAEPKKEPAQPARAKSIFPTLSWPLSRKDLGAIAALLIFCVVAAGMLMPSLGRARKEARRCVSNVRPVGELKDPAAEGAGAEAPSATEQRAPSEAEDPGRPIIVYGSGTIGKRLHDVTDITLKPKDFPGDLQTLREREGLSGEGSIGYKDMGGREGDTAKSTFTPEELTEFIKSTIAPETWDEVQTHEVAKAEPLASRSGLANDKVIVYFESLAKSKKKPPRPAELLALRTARAKGKLKLRALPMIESEKKPDSGRMAGTEQPLRLRIDAMGVKKVDPESLHLELTSKYFEKIQSQLPGGRRPFTLEEAKATGDGKVSGKDGPSERLAKLHEHGGADATLEGADISGIDTGTRIIWKQETTARGDDAPLDLINGDMKAPAFAMTKRHLGKRAATTGEATRDKRGEDRGRFKAINGWFRNGRPVQTEETPSIEAHFGAERAEQFGGPPAPDAPPSPEFDRGKGTMGGALPGPAKMLMELDIGLSTDGRDLEAFADRGKESDKVINDDAPNRVITWAKRADDPAAPDTPASPEADKGKSAVGGDLTVRGGVNLPEDIVALRSMEGTVYRSRGGQGRRAQMEASGQSTDGESAEGGEKSGRLQAHKDQKIVEREHHGIPDEWNAIGGLVADARLPDGKPARTVAGREAEKSAKKSGGFFGFLKKKSSYRAKRDTTVMLEQWAVGDGRKDRMVEDQHRRALENKVALEGQIAALTRESDKAPVGGRPDEDGLPVLGSLFDRRNRRIGLMIMRDQYTTDKAEIPHSQIMVYPDNWAEIIRDKKDAIDGKEEPEEPAFIRLPAEEAREEDDARKLEQVLAAAEDMGETTTEVVDQQPVPEGEPESVAVFKAVPVNPFVMTEKDHFSTFSLDVDTASYALARNYIRRGYLPPAASVRMEEFINAFDYNYPTHTGGVFTVHAEGMPSPFGRGLTLLKIGVQGRALGREGRKPAHLVFVVDASGSMARPDRMPLVQHGLKLLAAQLGAADRVSLVTFGSGANLLLEAVPANDERIAPAINAVSCGGSTNLVLGLEAGYEIARRGFRAGQINRVILCSDGVANIGLTDAEAMLKKVEVFRKHGIAFTSIGFGMGSYNDELLEKLANKGDGSYMFVDSRAEARRVFVEGMATLQTIAGDAKIQVEFDPARVRRYRLIGYENRDIADKDFRNDAIDAGEVGSGQSATALYEIELLESAEGADLGTVYVRYRNIDTGKVEEISTRLESGIIQRHKPRTAPRFYLAAAAAEFAEILRDSEHAADGNFANVKNIVGHVAAALPLDQRVRELLGLVARAQGLPRAQ